jgi:hypothetical protein
MRTLDFTPSDSSASVKLPSLRPCGAFRLLPAQLLNGTQQNPSMLKTLRLLYLRVDKSADSFFIPSLKRGGLSNFNRSYKVDRRSPSRRSSEGLGVG